MLPLVDKYRPVSRSQLIGNEAPINGLYLFLKNWQKNKSKPGALLLGPPGCGKTSGVYAIANDLGFVVTEFNASDTRNKSVIREKLGSNAEFSNFMGENIRKVILMDEIDGIAGNEDRGGIAELIKIFKKSNYPIICTANDPESDKITQIKKHLRIFNFERLDEYEIFSILTKICQKEAHAISEEIIDKIAVSCAGDLRAAINELSSQISGTEKIILEKRDKMEVYSTILNNLFNSKSLILASKSLNNVPSDYSRLLLFIFDECYNQYKTQEEVKTAYQQIALADLTYSRIIKTQQWGLLKYYFAFLSSGLFLTKQHDYHNKIRKLDNLPSSFISRGIANRKLSTANQIAERVTKHLHQSKRRFIYDDFELFSKIILGKGGAEIAAWLNLDDGLLENLHRLNPSSKILNNIEEAREKIGKNRLIESTINHDEVQLLKNLFSSEEINNEPVINAQEEHPIKSDDKNNTQASLEDFFG